MTRFLLPLLSLLVLLCTCAPSPEEQPPGEATAAGESDAYLRPLHHYTPEAGWMNDPNGLVFLDGEYHLFYQFFPDSNVWGPMHWGHAVSPDLVNWEELPIALYPTGADGQDYIFSGSAVVDRDNTAGFGRNALVAIFTLHDIAAERAGTTTYERQGIAYSTDRGRNWTMYAGNPVLPNPGDTKDFRDPKVVWDGSQWVMVLAVKDRVHFYGSPNLREWAFLSEFGADAPNHDGVWECPDLFPLLVDGTDDKVWVLIQSINPGGANGGSGTFYFTGQWDGSRFTPRPETITVAADSIKWMDWGRDNYAGVTFSNEPENAATRSFIGWMSNWDYAQVVPTTTWRSAMTLARRLTLRETAFGLRLFQEPVLPATTREPIALTTDKVLAGTTVIDLSTLPNPGVFELDIALDLVGSSGDQIYFTLSNAGGDQFYRCGFDRSADGAGLFSDRRQAGPSGFSEKFAPDRLTTAPNLTTNGELRLRAVFDRTSAELFWGDGSTVMTDIFFPEAPFVKLSIEANDGEFVVISGELRPL